MENLVKKAHDLINDTNILYLEKRLDDYPLSEGIDKDNLRESLHFHVNTVIKYSKLDLETFIMVFSN